jgi:hypothetical protein
MKEIQNVIAKESVLVIIVGPLCSGKSTFVSKLLEPFKTRNNIMPTVSSVNNSIMGVYCDLFVNNWGVTDEKVIVIPCVTAYHDEDNFDPSKLYRLSKFPRYFSMHDHTISERLMYQSPRKINAASIVVIISPENYEKCNEKMDSHYLVTMDKAFQSSITKTEGRKNDTSI